MHYPVLFEKITAPEFPDGYYYAHIPSLGLTTHGLGIEGARAAAVDLARLWITEKHVHGEIVPAPAECLLGTLEISTDALQSA